MLRSVAPPDAEQEGSGPTAPAAGGEEGDAAIAAAAAAAGKKGGLKVADPGRDALMHHDIRLAWQQMRRWHSHCHCNPAGTLLGAFP